MFQPIIKGPFNSMAIIIRIGYFDLASAIGAHDCGLIIDIVLIIGKCLFPVNAPVTLR